MTKPLVNGQRFTALICLAMCIISLIVVIPVGPSLSAASLIQEHLNNSGVENPVTAVLLNYRSIDTLLELAVIYVAVLPVCALSFNQITTVRCVHSDTVLRGLTSVVAPATIITAIYLLYNGTRLPGGAFQAAALLAGLSGLIAFSGFRHFLKQKALNNTLMVSGILIFTAIGFSHYILPASFLAYPREYATTVIITIEIFATVSITAILGRYISALPQARISL